jgi:hypothetical protein
MAWIFSLSAECGSSRQDAEKFRDYFRDVVLTLADGKKVRCSSDRYFRDPDEYFQDRDGNWWNFVIPEGMVFGGEGQDSTLRKKEGASEVGFLLYEHLKSAPFFRYAMVGLEVDGFLEESEFKTTDLNRYDGIVLSKDFYESLDVQYELEEFSPGYYWRPYLGEKQDF